MRQLGLGSCGEKVKPDRKLLMAEAERIITPRIGMYSTNAQIKAAARKMVDMAVAQARKGPQRDDL